MIAALSALRRAYGAAKALGDVEVAAELEALGKRVEALRERLQDGSKPG